MASVAAAGALVRVGKQGSVQGRAVLARTVKEGTTDEQLVATDLVSLNDPAAVEALEAAAKSSDPIVRVAAFSRLLDVPAQRAGALAGLEAIAAGNDGAARQARISLAGAGDPQAAPFLERDLASSGPTSRAQAALALFRMGRAEKMAPALADPDPSVRMRVACSVAGGTSG
jgi:HEAT repeat protein